jgi:hypothetical protein
MEIGRSGSGVGVGVLGIVCCILGVEGFFIDLFILKILKLTKIMMEMEAMIASMYKWRRVMN